VLYALKPVVIAIVVEAFWKLGRTAVKTKWLGVITVFAAALYAMRVHELFTLVIAAGLAATPMIFRRLSRRGPARLLTAITPTRVFAAAVTASAPFGLWRLFLVFAKIGAMLFGSGYVLLAFLRSDLVDRLHWLTERQLLDAVAVGQITPGPVFTTATFIGYVIGGVRGAIVATVGIFAPAFLFVAVSGFLIPRIRRSALASSMLDGVVVGSLALMGVVAWQLGRAAITDVPTLIIVGVSALLLLMFRINSIWLIAIAGMFGWVYRS
jgi:chromate transporter